MRRHTLNCSCKLKDPMSCRQVECVHFSKLELPFGKRTSLIKHYCRNICQPLQYVTTSDKKPSLCTCNRSIISLLKHRLGIRRLWSSGELFSRVISPEEVATSTAVGVASPSAQGHATTSTSIANFVLSNKAPEGPITSTASRACGYQVVPAQQIKNL